MSVSLDGLFAGPDGDLGWQLISEELHSFFNQHLAGMGAFLEGRMTYELMASHWPTADEDPDNPQPVKEFARIWREMPKIVYSRTLEHAGWNTTIVRDVAVEEVEALKAAPGGDLVIGGGDLDATFLRLGLVDELWLYVHPVVLGRGRPLFPAGLPLQLELVATRAFANGVVLLCYRSATG